mgnify:CR=1 FL=1
MSYYITRIFNNKLKLSVILFIFVAPILDILMAFVDVFKGASVPVPGLVTFLGSFMTAGLRGVLKGYLPLFLAIIVADDCIEDYRIGYKNILITKRGKNKYFALNMLKSFNCFVFVAYNSSLTQSPYGAYCFCREVHIFLLMWKC